MSRPRTARVLGALSLLTVLALTLACSVSVTTSKSSSSPATAASGGSTVPAGFAPYQNSEYGFSLAVPAKYKQADAAGYSASSGTDSVFSVGFGDPQGATAGGTPIDAMLVSVYRLTKTITPDLMPAFRSELQVGIGQLKAKDPSMKVKPLRDVNINGLPGYSLEYSLDNKGLTQVSRTYFLVSGDREYQITIQAAQQDWAANEPDMQRSVETFEAK